MSRNALSSRSIARQFALRVEDAVRVLGAARQPVLIGVSGGPDSTALLVALHDWKDEDKPTLAAAHANHGLRGEESDQDELFVSDLCRRMGVRLIGRRLGVPEQARQRGEGIEATARKLRQTFFAEATREVGARFVATAHTADDQAETVLHRVARGTGLAGLAGIPATRELVPGVRLIRPMLHLRRGDVLEYLRAVGQDFREDTSNRDLAFTRNRVRHELVPYLAEHFNPRIVDALGRLASLAADAQAVIDAEARRLLRRALVKRDASQAVLEAAPLRRARRFLVCEALRQLWADQSWPLQEIGQEELERVAGLVAGRAEAWDLPGGIRARLTRDRVVLAREGP